MKDGEVGGPAGKIACMVRLSRQLGTYQTSFQALLDFPQHTYEKISPSCSRSHEMEFTSMKADR